MGYQARTRDRSFLMGMGLLLAWLAAVGASDGQDLKVEARFPEGPTGTMHYAEALTLAIGSARPLRLESEDDLLPIPGPHFRLSPSGHLLVGWSSTGSGMQSLHVLSLDVRDGAVVLVQEMVLTTDRMSSGLLVRPDPAGGIRLGLPEPPAGYVHNEEGWLLSIGDPKAEPLNLERMRALPFEPVAQETNDVFYAPPFQLCRFPKRAAWIGVTTAGRFSLPGERGGDFDPGVPKG